MILSCYKSTENAANYVFRWRVVLVYWFDLIYYYLIWFIKSIYKEQLFSKIVYLITIYYKT